MSAARRAQSAFDMLLGKRIGLGRREFDRCFEMGDGREVSRLLQGKIAADPVAARHIALGWVDCAGNLGNGQWAWHYCSAADLDTACAVAGIELADTPYDDQTRARIGARRAAAAEPTTAAQRTALQLASPKRADSGRVIAQQQGEADLPLFAAADQLSLF